MKGAGIQPAVFQTEQAPVAGEPAEQAGRYTVVLILAGILLVAISGIVLYRRRRKSM
jgi:LPXTG-motif cell wall-anchored protein